MADAVEWNDDTRAVKGKAKAFSQMVWKTSKKVGFGYAKAADGNRVFIVVQYSPLGT